MQHQLVLQYPENQFDFDGMIEFEDELIDILTNDDIDGHDIGSGEINFFILTENPEECKNKILKNINSSLIKNLKIASRKINEEKYTILHPSSLKEFTVK